MTIQDGKLKLTLEGNEISSIDFNGTEVLNTTKKWSKKFPVLFPAIGPNKSYVINDVNYSIPRHGFWKELDFGIEKKKNELRLVKEVQARKDYPFIFLAEQKIKVQKRLTKGIESHKVVVSTTFEAKKAFPMQFGYHPAFNYDSGEIEMQGETITLNKDGSSSKGYQIVRNIKDMDWENVDTFIIKTKEAILHNRKYSLKVKTNMKYLALWTNGDKYICIEPYSNIPALIKPNDNIKMDGKPLKISLEFFNKK